MTPDRCANPRCRTSIDLDWSAYGCACGAVVTCEGCDPVEACEECRRWTVPADPFAPEDHETFEEVMGSVPDLRAGDRAYHDRQADNYQAALAAKEEEE